MTSPRFHYIKGSMPIPATSVTFTDEQIEHILEILNALEWALQDMGFDFGLPWKDRRALEEDIFPNNDMGAYRKRELERLKERFKDAPSVAELERRRVKEKVKEWNKTRPCPDLPDLNNRSLKEIEKFIRDSLLPPLNEDEMKCWWRLIGNKEELTCYPPKKKSEREVKLLEEAEANKEELQKLIRGELRGETPLFKEKK